MKLMYIDESGDPGTKLGSSPYYTLSGLIIDAGDWKEFYNQFEDFKRLSQQKLGGNFGEFKGSKLFMHQGAAFTLQIKPADMQWLYDNLMRFVFDIKIWRIIVSISKEQLRAHYPNRNPDSLTKELRLITWETFLSRFEQTLREESQQRGKTVTGLVYIDGKPDKHVSDIVKRYARRYDWEQPFAAAGIIESPVFIDSKASTLIQLADMLAYSTNYLLRIHDPLESLVRIHREIAKRVHEEIINPLK